MQQAAVFNFESVHLLWPHYKIATVKDGLRRVNIYAMHKIFGICNRHLLLVISGVLSVC